MKENELILKNVCEIKEAKVKPFGQNGAHIIVPKAWIGEVVQVILKE